MVRKTDNNAGWRPMYRGLVDCMGYALKELAADSPDFPTNPRARKLLRDVGGDSLTFIIRSGGIWRNIIESDQKTAFLDVLNLECGDDTLRNVFSFLNKYGAPSQHDPEPPSATATRFDTLEEMILLSKTMRRFVDDIFKSGSDLLVSCDNIRVRKFYVDLKTHQTVIEAGNVEDFAFMQIADAFSRKIEFTNCEECAAYMTPKRVKGENRRKTCSDACRQKAHRGGS
jgi:hypothetical protein